MWSLSYPHVAGCAVARQSDGGPKEFSKRVHDPKGARIAHSFCKKEFDAPQRVNRENKERLLNRSGGGYPLEGGRKVDPVRQCAKGQSGWNGTQDTHAL
jgi:hypothetical protein